MIPIAIQFLKKDMPLFSGYATDFYTDNDIAAIMRDYAQLHVEAALKAAVKNGKIYHNGFDWVVDDKSIVDSYPINNIK